MLASDVGAMSRHSLKLLLIWLMLFGGFSIYAQSQSFFASPDGELRAQVIPAGEGRVQTSESRIEIRTAHGRLLRWKSFASKDGEHGEGVVHAAWTADSQFFVFNTENSGGHQPWHRLTYFYSRRWNRFYRLDDFIGPVTSDFTLEGRNTVKTTYFNFAADQEKEPTRVRLGRLSTRGKP
jgi:hypothetical protein